MTSCFRKHLMSSIESSSFHKNQSSHNKIESDTSQDWETCIGLEIHAQMKTESKLFSQDSTAFGAPENKNTHPVSLGFPGTLPVLNEYAVECAIKTGLALNCDIQSTSIFARKNYFYPDLPKGYQISQYDEPLCSNGFVEFFEKGKKKRVQIERAHLEEDAGKLTHLPKYSLVNFNRSGIPLLEIVSQVAVLSPSEASEYVRMVRRILCYIDTCNGNLEEGSLRCDCNISLRKKGETSLGVKVEVKNINSFRFIEKALEYERQRQIKRLNNNQDVLQETRLYNPSQNKTFPLRSKEEAHEYRYFPDPDLMPLKISSEYMEKMKASLPELPFQKETRFKKEYHLSDYEAHFLSQDPKMAQGFEHVAKESQNAKSAAKWIMGEVTRELNQRKKNFSEIHFILKHLVELIQLIDKGDISEKIGKEIFLEVWEKDISPKELVQKKSLTQIKDLKHIEKIVKEVISENPKQREQYQKGKIKLFGYFFGSVMKKTKGQAHPETVDKVLKKYL